MADESLRKYLYSALTNANQTKEERKQIVDKAFINVKKKVAR